MGNWVAEEAERPWAAAPDHHLNRADLVGMRLVSANRTTDPLSVGGASSRGGITRCRRWGGGLLAKRMSLVVGARTACEGDSVAPEGGVIGGAPLFLSI